MPKEMEEKLKKIAGKKGFGKERTNKFVYGTMRNAGSFSGKTIKGRMSFGKSEDTEKSAKKQAIKGRLMKFKR